MRILKALKPPTARPGLTDAGSVLAASDADRD
jgi:hypothetical protein